MRQLYAVLCIFTAGIFLSGCATSPQRSDDPEVLDLKVMIERTTDYQREIIADGVVTSAELERALLARRECVSAAGAIPSDIYENEAGEPTFDFDITAESEEQLRDVQEAADACLVTYFSDVGALWAYQKLLSPEERDEQRPLAISCLESAGASGLADDATAQEMVEAVQADEEFTEAERACLVEFHGFFSTWTNERDDHTH